MNEEKKKKLYGRRVKVWTKRGYFYQGTVTDESAINVWLMDELKKNEFIVRKDWISTIQILSAQKPEKKVCRYCRQELTDNLRKDAIFCTASCRVMHWRKSQPAGHTPVKGDTRAY